MKNVEIDERDYQAIAARYGSFELFVQQAARQAEAGPAAPDAESFLQSAGREGGLLEGGSEYAADLSSNPAHLEGFGQ